MAQHYHLYMSIHVYMKRMTRLCDIKYCVYDNLEVYRTHTSDYCVRTVLLRISLQVYSVKILGRNKTSKYYVTFDEGESTNSNR